MTGAGDPTRFRVCVTATTYQRGIADAAGKFAASAAGGSSSEEVAVDVECDRADRA